MSNDEKPKTSATTRPPPAGQDLYEASTVVGEASADILAIVRETEDAKLAAIPKAPAVPSVAHDDRASDAPTRVGPLPTDVAVTAPPPPMPAVAKVELALAPAPAPAPARGGLPPAVGIALFFIAVAAVLAALVR